VSRKNHKSPLDKYARDIFSSLVESALITGTIDKTDFNDRKKLKEKILNSIPKNDSELYFVIVHHPDLLEEAELYIRKGKYEYAYIFYAAYFEHYINEIIQIWCFQHKVPDEVFKELIRKLGLEDKFTWLIRLLKLPDFNSLRYKVISKIAEKRNAFVHYKYQPQVATTPIDYQKAEWKNLKADLIKTLRYCKTYRSKLVYAGKKAKFKS
jgi:hypothetical protein